MSMFIGYQSAIWAHVRSDFQLHYARPHDLTSTHYYSSITNVASVEQGIEALMKLYRGPVEGKIWTITHSKPKQRSTRLSIERVWGLMPQSPCFIQIAPGCYLSTIEFCFLQMAREIPYLQLVQLGHALCGRYFPASCEEGFIVSPQLTTVEKLENFLAGCSEIQGVKKARRALQVIRNNSYSPMETIVSMLLTMPRQQGGCGLPQAMLNHRVPLSPEARHISHKRECYLDLAWPKVRFALEYMGLKYHAHPGKDEQRRLSLEHDGWDLRYIFAQQILDTKQREEIMRLIVKKFGNRFKPLSKTTIQKQRILLENIQGRKTCRENGADRWRLPAALSQKRDSRFLYSRF